TKSELFLAKIQTLNFEKLLSSGGQKGKGLGGRNFCPPSLFRRRRISYFALRNAPPKKMLPLPQPSRARATSRNSLFDLRFH
ncbi:hypothetical protein KJ611_04750, partial [Patescibacteria group bacterium]|nr:hypothetical protein [Patescibacteria group bacterium]